MISDAANTMTLPMTSSCRISGISRWTPGTHLAGIHATGTLWEIDSGFFSCCGATGIEVHNLQKKMARFCGLTQRWSQLKDHIQFTVKTFPSQILTDILGLGAQTRSQSHLSTAMLDALSRWRQLNSVALVSHARGRLVADNTEIMPGVTVDWAGAASLIWHDGVRVFMHLHGSGSPPFARWQRELQTTPGRTVIWIDRVHNLFDAAKLLEFDTVISFASSHGLPLWVDLAKIDSESKSESRKFAKSLDRKMSNYRRGPIEKWLSPQTLGRLREVCDLPLPKAGAEPFVIPPVV